VPARGSGKAKRPELALVGARLAREGGVSVESDFDYAGLFAGKPRSYKQKCAVYFFINAEHAAL
jgi:hypothetical protein